MSRLRALRIVGVGGLVLVAAVAITESHGYGTAVMHLALGDIERSFWPLFIIPTVLLSASMVRPPSPTMSHHYGRIAHYAVILSCVSCVALASAGRWVYETNPVRGLYLLDGEPKRIIALLLALDGAVALTCVAYAKGIRLLIGGIATASFFFTIIGVWQAWNWVMLLDD